MEPWTPVINPKNFARELLTPDGVRKRPADETSLGLVAGVVDLEGPRIVGGVLRAQHSTRCARRD